MMIIGCDLHTRYQQIAMLDTESGELVERRLEHANGEARAFYAALVGAVRVGIEATGHTHWFEAMLAELGHELWMGDAAKIRAAVVRKQKTDARDAAHLLELMCSEQASVERLDQAVEQAAKSQPLAVRLMTHPGVGPVTSLAFVLIIGPVDRFAGSRQVVSYLGLNPQEHSSGGKQRLGSISKQGNPMMRSLLVEAGHTAARMDPQLRRVYQRLKFRRGASVAKVAVARKLAVRMYWMLRRTADYAQLVRMQGSPWATLVEKDSSLG